MNFEDLLPRVKVLRERGQVYPTLINEIIMELEAEARRVEDENEEVAEAYRRAKSIVIRVYKRKGLR